MDAKEKAAQIYDQYWSAVSRGPVNKQDPLPDMRPLLEKALIEAEEAGAKREREACAELLDKWAEVNIMYGRKYEAEIMTVAAKSIRARSEGEGKSQDERTS